MGFVLESADAEEKFDGGRYDMHRDIVVRSGGFQRYKWWVMKGRPTINTPIGRSITTPGQGLGLFGLVDSNRDQNSNWEKSNYPKS